MAPKTRGRSPLDAVYTWVLGCTLAMGNSKRHLGTKVCYRVGGESAHQTSRARSSPEMEALNLYHFNIMVS